MSGVVNWKAKYMELKSKFMESVDVAFRLGFEQGAQQAKQDNVMQQQQQQQDLAMAEAQGMNTGPGGPSGFGGDEQSANPGSEGPGATMPAGPGKGIEQPDSANPGGSELDQHIEKLESMLGQPGSNNEMIKSLVGDLKNLQKSISFKNEMRKSAQAIPEIAKALHKPKFKIGVQASHNMNQNAKNAVTMQHKIVEDIMEKWESEEKDAHKDILAQLDVEGLTKNE